MKKVKTYCLLILLCCYSKSYSQQKEFDNFLRNINKSAENMSKIVKEMGSYLNNSLSNLEKILITDTALLQSQSFKKAFGYLPVPTDTALKQMPINISFDASNPIELFINNANRDVYVLPYNGNKLNISTTLFYTGNAPTLEHNEWFKKLNIIAYSTNNRVNINIGTLLANIKGNSILSNTAIPTANTASWNDVNAPITVFNSNGAVAGYMRGQRDIIVNIPYNMPLNIQTKMGSITLKNGLKKASILANNTKLDIGNINNLHLKAEFGSTIVNQADTMQATLDYVQFKSKYINQLTAETQHSKIDMATVNNLTLKSTDDEIEIDEINHIMGTKKYGSLRLNELNQKAVIFAQNCDVKIRKISSSATYIGLKNKFAELKLPLSRTNNYTLNYVGNYSAFYFKGDNIKENAVMSNDDKSFFNINEKNTPPNNFSITNGTGKNLKINVQCENCALDFK